MFCVKCTSVSVGYPVAKKMKDSINVRDFVRISQFEQQSELCGSVGQNLEVVQIGVGEKTVHPVNNYFGAKMK